MFLPPGPMRAPILSGLIWTVSTRGAYGWKSSRGRAIAGEHALQDRAAGPRGPAPAPRGGDPGEIPVILMSIWSAVMPALRAGHLEVHVARVVLVAEDVGEDDVTARPR